MKKKRIKVRWPDGNYSIVNEGDNWLDSAKKSGQDISTGCLRGNCGACEIEVEGKVIRSCITNIKEEGSKVIRVEILFDPYW